MANNVAASMKASIVIDKKEVVSSVLSAYAEAQKEIDGHKLEFLIDVSDDKALEKIKEIKKELTGKDYVLKFKNQGVDEIVENLNILEKRLKDIFSGKAFGTGTGKGIGNSIVDEKSLQTVLDLFTKMESHLGDMKRIFSDVGDGGEFSPLLSTIEKINVSITELSKSVKGIGLNMNIDFGSDKELEAKAEAKISNALQAYQRLFDHIKMTSVGGSIITQKFFDFDINQFDGMMGKLNAYKKFIENMRTEAKEQFSGNDVLYQEADKKYWTSVSSAMGQVTKAFNEMKASGDTNPLEKIFGGSKDLSEVTTQLSLITDKLDEISKSAYEFKNVFKEGFNISSSIEDIEKLTNRVKELEEELSKVKLSPNVSSTPIKDTFQGDLKASAESSIPSVKEEAKAMEQVAENAEKASKGKDKFAKANKKVKESADSSADSIDKETSALDEKEWDKNVKAIQEYMDANTKLNNLKAQDAGTGKKAKEIEYNVKKVEELEKAAIEARAILSSMINPHEAPIDDWNKWLDVMKQFDQAAVGSAESLAKLEDSLRNMAKSQFKKVSDTLSNSEKYLELLKPTEGNRSVKFEGLVQEYNKAVNSLKEFRATLDATTPLTQEQSDKFEELANDVKKARIEIDKIPKAQRGSDEDARMKEIDKLTKYLDVNTRISKEAKQQLQGYLALLKSGDPSVSVKELHTEWTRVAVAEREAGREGKKFWDLVTDKAFSNRAAQLVSYYLSFTDIIRYTQEGIKVIRELDTALTEMRKVSDETVSSLERLQDVSFDLADDVGTTAKAIQDATASWMRLGESLEEAKQSAQDANVLFRVSEFESIDEATESLVAMSAAYKDLEKSQINDVLNEIGNNYAISTDELASALQKSAATLSIAGNDIYEAAALVTAGNAVLQDADSVGTGKFMPEYIVICRCIYYTLESSYIG